MNRRDVLSTDLEKALVSGGLPRDPAQVVGRLFCLIYVAPLTDEENDERFYKYYGKASFEEYMQQSLSDEAGKEDERANPEELLLLEEAVYGTITGIAFDGVDQCCWLYINPIGATRGTISSIYLGGRDEMSRIYPDIDETDEEAKGNYCQSGLPCSITIL